MAPLVRDLYKSGIARGAVTDPGFLRLFRRPRPARSSAAATASISVES